MAEFNLEGDNWKYCETEVDFYQYQLECMKAVEEKNAEEWNKWNKNGRKGKYDQYRLKELSFIPDEGIPYSVDASQILPFRHLHETAFMLSEALTRHPELNQPTSINTALQTVLNARKPPDLSTFDRPFIKIASDGSMSPESERLYDEAMEALNAANQGLRTSIKTPYGVTVYQSVEAARTSGLLAFSKSGNERAFVIYTDGNGNYWLGSVREGMEDHIQVSLGDQEGIIAEIVHSHYGSEASDKDKQTADAIVAYNKSKYNVETGGVSTLDMNTGEVFSIQGNAASQGANDVTTLNKPQGRHMYLTIRGKEILTAYEDPIEQAHKLPGDVKQTFAELMSKFPTISDAFHIVAKHPKSAHDLHKMCNSQLKVEDRVTFQLGPKEGGTYFEPKEKVITIGVKDVPPQKIDQKQIASSITHELAHAMYQGPKPDVEKMTVEEFLEAYLINEGHSHHYQNQFVYYLINWDYRDHYLVRSEGMKIHQNYIRSPKEVEYPYHAERIQHLKPSNGPTYFNRFPGTVAKAREVFKQYYEKYPDKKPKVVPEPLTPEWMGKNMTYWVYYSLEYYRLGGQ